MRKELMNRYHAGELKDLALYEPNNNEKYVICLYGGGFIFGYYQFQEGKKQFFKATTLERSGFKVKKVKLNVNLFEKL
jgi:hypothetical protein